MATPHSPSTGRSVGRVLLVGYGALGRRLAPLLLPDAVEVIAVGRSLEGLTGGTTGIVADLAAAPAPALPAIDSMVITLPPGDGDHGYRTMLANLAQSLTAPPARTVFVSSTGVFAGSSADRPLTEDDVPQPTTPRARGIREGEEAALALFSATILRPAGIYGPGREFLVRQVREQRPVDYDRWTNRIHEDDLVRALETLLRAESVPPVLHAVDSEPVPLGEVVTLIAELLALPAPPHAEVAGPHGHVLDGTRLHEVLGWLQHPSYVSGYREMILPR